VLVVELRRRTAGVMVYLVDTRKLHREVRMARVSWPTHQTIPRPTSHMYNVTIFWFITIRTRLADSALHAGPAAWNLLPDCIRNLTSHYFFSPSKTYLFLLPV